MMAKLSMGKLDILWKEGSKDIWHGFLNELGAKIKV